MTTKKELFEIAKDEIQQWDQVPSGITMAILFAFIHRITEGETIEETMAKLSQHRTT